MDAIKNTHAFETVIKAIFGKDSQVKSWIVFPVGGPAAGMSCRHVAKIMAEILVLPIPTDMSRPAPVCGEIG